MKLLLHSIFAILCLLMADFSFADDFETEKEACSSDSSKKWNSSLNRCMTSESTKSNLTSYTNCTLFEEKTKRDECMRNLVLEVSGDAKLEDTNWDALVMDGISLGISISNLTYVSKKKSPCISVKIGAACGAAAVIKTLYVMNKAKKETEENLKDFQQKVADEDNYDTQLIAYQSQIDQLNSLAKYYRMKAKFNKVVAACYTVTALATLADEAKMSQSCIPVDDATPPKDGSPEKQIEESQITAKVDAKPNLMSQVSSLGKSIGAYLKTPAGVATVSLINVGWNIYKAKKLTEQGDKAELLAKRAKVAKDQFITAMGKYCPDGHDDMSNLLCYCYEDGEKNASRTNSDSCQALWETNERNLFADSSDKTKASAVDTTKMGCLTNVGEFDPTCQCKKFVDTQGNNACKKSSFSSIQLGGLSQAMDLTQLEQDLDNVNSGIDSAQGFDLTSAQSSALTGTVRDQILRQIKVEDKNGLRSATPNDLATVEKALLSGVSRELAASPINDDPFEKDLTRIQGEVEASLNTKKVVNKLKLSAGNGISGNNTKKQSFALNLRNSSGTVEKYPSYMDKTYKTKNADVVTNKDVSIFKVLSNRYYKSGFKRLFED